MTTLSQDDHNLLQNYARVYSDAQKALSSGKDDLIKYYNMILVGSKKETDMYFRLRHKTPITDYCDQHLGQFMCNYATFYMLYKRDRDDTYREKYELIYHNAIVNAVVKFVDSQKS